MQLRASGEEKSLGGNKSPGPLLRIGCTRRQGNWDNESDVYKELVLLDNVVINMLVLDTDHLSVLEWEAGSHYRHSGRAARDPESRRLH
jgi:hypothetical protein